MSEPHISRVLPAWQVPQNISEQTKDALLAVCFYLFSRTIMLIGVIISMLPHIIWDAVPYAAVIWSQVHDDSGWYHYIASSGYIKQDTPFFPLYPLLVRGVHFVFSMSYTTAGLVVSNAAYVIALYLLLRLFRRVVSVSSARYGVLAFALYPMAIFNSSMYTESLFVTLIAATWLCLLDRKYLRAGIFGFFAVLTRNEGGLLWIPFFWTMWHQKRSDGEIPQKSLFAALLLPLAGVLYLGYQWVKFGNPLLFMTEEHLWGRHFLFPIITLFNGFIQFPHLWSINGWYGKVYYTIENVSVIFVLLFLPIVWRKLPKDWFFFLLFMILIPLSDPATGVISITPQPHLVQDWFFSFSRFVIPMMPLWGAIGSWVSKGTWKKILYFSFSSAGLVFVSAMINLHYFLA